MTSSHPPHVGGESAPGYLLDNARAEAGERFVWLAELFDGVTRGHVDRLGIGAGARCWEVGAGGPGVPQALAAAVGPTGYVLATDIDPAWLEAGGGYEVRRHDVAADPPPEPGTFDLVHARLVLVHIPDRARALATMVAALRPGGWLLIEDADTALQPLACLDDSGPAQRRANRLRDAVRELLAGRGADLRFGRTLPRALRAAGLVDVAAAGSFPVGGLACDRLEAATIRHVQDLTSYVVANKTHALSYSCAKCHKVSRQSTGRRTSVARRDPAPLDAGRARHMGRVGNRRRARGSGTGSAAARGQDRAGA